MEIRWMRSAQRLAAMAPMALFSALAALAAPVSAQTTSSIRAVPNPAPADQKFRLYLQLPGLCWSCGNVFSHESVTVAGNRIDLRYVVTVPIAPKSPPPDSVPLRLMSVEVPGFSLAPLAAGQYELWSAAVPACLLTVPTCEIAEPAPVRSGLLEVSGDVTGVYIPRIDSTAAGHPFDLQILGTGYSCATAFDSLAVAVSGNVITLTYYDFERPMGCAAAYELAGPMFKMPSLSAGTYRLKIERLSNHTRSDAGTLLVTGSVAIGKPDSPGGRKTGTGGAEKGVRSRSGDEVTFTLPKGGSGIWSVELLSPEGRIWKRSVLIGATGDRVSLRLGRDSAHHGKVLRLRAPDGSHRWLPLPG